MNKVRVTKARAETTGTTKPFVPVTGKKIPGGAGTQGPNLQVDMFAWGGPFKFKFKFKNTLEGGYYLGTYSDRGQRSERRGDSGQTHKEELHFFTTKTTYPDISGLCVRGPELFPSS